MPKPYPNGFRDDVRASRGTVSPSVTIEQVAKEFSVHSMTPTKWTRNADIDEGTKPGLARVEGAELREARKRFWLLEQVNQVLRPAAAYLA